MAFNTAPAPRGNDQTKSESWKAQGFLNFYLPTKDGGRRKVGAIPLKESKATEKQLLDWLNENPEENARTLMNKLELDFQMATPAESGQLDLG